MRLSYFVLAMIFLGLPPAQAQTNPMAALPGNDLDTRGASPSAPAAGDIVSGDAASTHTQVPSDTDAPETGATVQQLLTIADQAIVAGQPAKADAALEMAETRILPRSGLATQTSYASQDPVARQIEQARAALSAHDIPAARQTIGQILASHAPELGD
jgi:hypothetical protein